MTVTAGLLTITDTAATPLQHPLTTYSDGTREMGAHVIGIDAGGTLAPVSKTAPFPVGTGLLMPTLTIQKSSSAITYSSTALIVGGGTGGFVASATPFVVGKQYRLTDCKLSTNKNNGALGTSGGGFCIYFANGTFVAAGSVTDGAALASFRFTGGAATIGRCDAVLDQVDAFSDCKIGFGGTALVVANVFTATATTLSAFMVTRDTNYPSMASEVFSITPTFEILN